MPVTDTHALIFYLLEKAPEKVRNKFKKAEAGKETIHIPTLALAELHYANQQERIEIDYEELLERIKETKGYKIIPFNYEILKEFTNIKGLNIHDQIITATAKHLNQNILTKDPEIQKLDVKTIWN